MFLSQISICDISDKTCTNDMYLCIYIFNSYIYRLYRLYRL